MNINLSGRLFGSALALLLIGSSCVKGSGSRSLPSKPSARASYARLPLSFEPNQGQADPEVVFLAHAGGASLFLTKTEAVLSLASRPGGSRKPGPGKQPSTAKPPSVLRLSPVGASPAEVVGQSSLPGTVNYFIGQDPSAWRAGIPTFSRATYKGLWPGVDLAFHGDQSLLEFDAILAPGADPDLVKLRLQGARSLVLDRGAVLARTKAGDLRLGAPHVYQVVAGRRVPVPGSLHLAGDVIGFSVGSHDPSLGVVIDPTLAYSTFLGGDGRDDGLGIAVDSTGSAYMAGATGSTNFPTASPLQATNAGNVDAFVAKLAPSGSSLVYSTYLGGGSTEVGEGIAIDPAGSAYVTGFTQSTDFPTMNPFQASKAGSVGSRDAFVTKLAPSGSSLVYSTYLGGEADEIFATVAEVGIAVDSAGSAYVTGETQSTDFPTMNPLQASNAGGNGDAFVTKLAPSGSSLAYSTYLGGSGEEAGRGIALDSSGSAYVAGNTSSINFPTVNPFQASNAGGNGDAFVTKLAPSGSSLAYSTYLGGIGFENGEGIAVNSSGYAYVTGETDSANFPTVNPFQAAPGSDNDAFVTKLAPSGSSLAYSTYLGGGGFEIGFRIAVDSSGYAYVTGETYSTDFPTMNAFQASNAGILDAFVTQLPPSGSSLVFSTYLGGSSLDTGKDIAVDSEGSAYVIGATRSTNFPTVHPFQASSGDDGDFGDAFVTKLSTSGPSGRRTLTVSKSLHGQSEGTVTSNPAGIDCGTTCTAQYDDGTVVTLTATPVPGSTFGGWSGACTNTTGNCVVTMDTEKAVTASFAGGDSGRRYLALGDSVTYGHGLANPRTIQRGIGEGPSPDCLDDCRPNQGPANDLASFKAAYPSWLQQALGLDLNVRSTGCGDGYEPGSHVGRLTGDQLAVSGATSSFANALQPSDGGDGDCPDVTFTDPFGNTYLSSTKPHKSVEPEELAAANIAGNPPVLVTILVGANDIRFDRCLAYELFGLAANYGLAHPVNCLKSASEVTADVRGYLNKLENSLRSVILNIKNRAPNATIVVLDYYQIIPRADEQVHGGFPICDAVAGGGFWNDRQVLRFRAEVIQRELNKSIDSVIDTLAEVVQIHLSELFDHKEMCVVSTSQVFDDPTWRTGHPNAVGQHSIYQAVRDVLALCDIGSASRPQCPTTTLQAAPTSNHPGGQQIAAWSIPSWYPPRPTATDWVGLYPLGAPDGDYRSFTYTNGQSSSSAQLQIPVDAAPGTYELRLFSNNSATRLATSNTFQVTGQEATARRLTVTNAGTGAGTVAAADNSVNCGPSCQSAQANYADGTRVTLTATTSGGSTFAGWSGACTNPAGDCVVTMDADKAVRATFTQTGPGATLTATPANNHPGGQQTATWQNIPRPSATDWIALYSVEAPDNGYRSSTYTNGQSSGSAQLQVPVDAAPGTYELRLFANNSSNRLATSNTFQVDTQEATARRLTVSKAGTGTGTITSDPAGINCGSQCTSTYGDGTGVILTATTAAGSTFAGWSGACTNTAGDCVVTMGADKVVTATFTLTGAGATLNATPASNHPGGQQTATWQNIPRPSATDWVGLYALGAANGDYRSFTYTNGQSSGSAQLQIPVDAAPGTYELRLFSNNTLTRLATSNSFQVQ